MTWRAWVAALGGVLGLVVLVGLGWMLNNWLWQRSEIDRLNDLADADSLRLVWQAESVRVYARRARVAQDVADHISEVARDQLEAARLEARAGYQLAVSYRNQLVGEQSRAEPVDQDTRLPIYLHDDELTIKGAVFLRDHIVPPSIRIDARLEAILHRLGLEVVVGEAADGGLVVQVTTQSPNVQVVEVEGVTDLRSTGAHRNRPGFFKGFLGGFATGSAVTAVLAAVVTLFGGS